MVDTCSKSRTRVFCYLVTAKQQSSSTAGRTRVRIVQIAFLTLAVIATFGLAWWQWTRFRSGSGTFQNLGYALQWPFFGAFFVYAYRMYLRYEKELAESSISPVEREKQEKIAKGKIELIDESLIPQRPTMDVDTFNALNQQRRRKPSSDAEIS